MRTTVRLEPSLLKQAKRYALEKDTTLTDILGQGIQLLLKTEAARKKHPKIIKLLTFAGKGLQAGIDLDDNAALLDVMDQHDSH